MNIMTVVYGEKYVEMFKKGCLASLSFPLNRSELYRQKAVWHIFTHQEDIPKLKALIDAFLPELELKFYRMSSLRDYVDSTQSALIKVAKNCLERNVKFLMAPPDTIFSDGAISGMIKAGEPNGSCVAVAHPRVLNTIFKESFLHSVSSRELVTLAWRNLHRAWIDAEVGCIGQSSHIGGVWWEKKGGVISVRHVLPTIYLCNFLQKDLVYFQAAPNFGVYDHVWPSELVREGRQVYITDSDEAFIVEVTDQFKNIPPQSEGPQDRFWRSHPHNEYNKNVEVLFRDLMVD